MSIQPATASYADFVRRLFNTSGVDPSKDFAHAVLGIVTEIYELLAAEDTVNAIEELGDLEFYLQAMEQVIEDHSGDTLPMDDIEQQVKDEFALYAFSTNPEKFLDLATNDLLDQAKRWVGYGKEPAGLPAVYALAVCAVAFARDLCRWPTNDASKEHIRSVNMAKLLKRYPGGDFDQFRALQRDLGAERAVLEAATLG